MCELRENFVMNGKRRHHLISAVIHCENGPMGNARRESELSKLQTTPTHTWQKLPAFCLQSQPKRRQIPIEILRETSI